MKPYEIWMYLVGAPAGCAVAVLLVALLGSPGPVVSMALGGGLTLAGMWAGGSYGIYREFRR